MQKFNPITIWRQKHSITQQSLAEKVGVSISRVGAWETNTHFPSWINIVKLGRLMRRNPAKLEFEIRQWMLERKETTNAGV